MTHLGLGGYLLVAGAALLAGAVNSIAGGGTLISFPALLFVGLPPVSANVTSTLGLLPGYAGGSAAYRRELTAQGDRVRALGTVSAVGAVVGAVLLTRASPRLFSLIVPWLILLASGLMLVQPWLAARVATHRVAGDDHRSRALLVGQFLSAVYGAFFGAGLGVMMLAVLGVFLHDDLQRINALKGVLQLVVNLVAAACFALFGPVVWGVAVVMLAGSVAGGFAGVSLARRLSPGVLRAVVVAFGVAVAVRMLV